jgi:endonuclease YncB( thermonuclease family)
MMGIRVPVGFTDWPADLPATYGPYRAVVCHHVDGDTFDALIDFGFNEYRYHPIRVLGVDTPETNRAATKAAGLAAKDYVQRVMPVGDRVLLHTRPDPDSFGRYLARVQLPGGLDLASLILSAGHGVPA